MSPEPQPINFGSVGDMDMFPAETAAAVREIYEAGKIIGDEWRKRGPEIAFDEGKVNTGFDELSTIFREQYNARKPMLEKVANQAQDDFEKMGTAGNDIVVRYLELTQQQVDRMRSLE
jgi:hypothetical protein